MTRANRTRNESGFVTAWMIGFAVLLLLLGAVFFEFGAALVQRQKLMTAADRAADAGATAIDEDELIASNGTHVYLASPGAINRCTDVLINESTSGQAKGLLDISKSECQLDGADRIVVNVKGTVSYGVIASWLGNPSDEFSVTSYATPSCSDSTQNTGAC